MGKSKAIYSTIEVLCYTMYGTRVGIELLRQLKSYFVDVIKI